MKTQLLLGLIMMGATSAPALAQEHVGNGGDAIVCNGGKDIYMLDYVESKTRAIQITESQFPKTTAEIVNLVLSRLERLDDRGTNYVQLANEMIEDDQAFTGAEMIGKQIAFTNQKLVDIDDSNEFQLPDGCEKKQLIIQTPPKRPEDRRFVIYAPLWKLMNPFQRAMAITHELFYGEAIGLKHSDSRNVRYLNSMLFSNQLQALTVQDWYERLKASKFPLQYGKACIKTPTFSPTGELVEADLARPYFVEMQEGFQLPALTIQFNPGTKEAKRLTRIDFEYIRVYGTLALIDGSEKFEIIFRYTKKRRLFDIAEVNVEGKQYTATGKIFRVRSDLEEAWCSRGCTFKTLNPSATFVFHEK